MKTLSKKQLTSFRARIKRDNNSLSCMGAVMLQMEYNNMHLDSLVELRNSLLNSRAPISHDSLNESIADRSK